MTHQRPYVTACQRVRACAPLALLLGALLTGDLAAQYPTATVVRRGLLRLGFEPHYTNYDQRFAFNNPDVADGARELLGTDLTALEVGSNLFPSVLDSEAAVRDLLSDPDYRVNVGAFRTIMDADIRVFPLAVAFGLSTRLTLTAHIPLVTFRSQVDFNHDSTGANVGWNPALTGAAGAAAAEELAALVGQLGSAATDLQLMIDGGAFGCPGSAQCLQAMDIAGRAQRLLLGITGMTDLNAQGTPQPFAPLATSPAGLAILAELSAVSAALQSLGATAPTAGLPLPTQPLETADIDMLLGMDGLGFEAAPIDFIRGTKLGDVEVGLRYGILDRPGFRALVGATLRLPTGTPDMADNYVDIGFGDGQPDVVVSFEAALAGAQTASIAVFGSYTLQMKDRLERRVAAPDTILAPLGARFLVDRNLGDIVTVGAYPTLRLTDAFRVFGSVNYYRKGFDRFSLAEPAPAVDPVVERLERETAARALSFGGGIVYRRVSDSGALLPIEAGLSYRSTFSGSGGLTAKSNHMMLHLRLFYRIFGGANNAVAEPPPTTSQ